MSVRRIRQAIVAVMMLFGFALVPVGTASAAVCTGSLADCAKQGAGTAGSGGSQPCLFQSGKDVDSKNGDPNCKGNSIFKTIVNIILFVIGAVAVIMIIIGGVRYVVSGGDSSAVGAAKNTILYAVVGLVVAILAYAIVNFVLTSLL